MTEYVNFEGAMVLDDLRWEDGGERFWNVDGEEERREVVKSCLRDVVGVSGSRDDLRWRKSHLREGVLILGTLFTFVDAPPAHLAMP